MAPAGQEIAFRAGRGGGTTTALLPSPVDTPVGVNYYGSGGILHTVLRNMLREAN